MYYWHLAKVYSAKKITKRNAIRLYRIWIGALYLNRRFEYRGAKITGSENNTVYSILTVDVADDEDLRQAHNEEGPGGHVVVHQLQDVHATLW